MRSAPGARRVVVLCALLRRGPAQAFDDLTMLVVGVANLGALTASRQPCLTELLGSLTSLHIYLEDLLLEHGGYLVDCLEDRLVIVFGEA